MNASRQSPTDPDDGSRTEPPHARQISSARSNRASTEESVDSKPTTSSVESAAPVNRASSASISRQLLGPNPLCPRALTASTPSMNESNETPRESRNSGRG